MTPNPRVTPYVCFTVAVDHKMEVLLRRRYHIVESIYKILQHGELEDYDQELLAQFNALLFVTGNLFGDLIDEGKDAKEMWRLYSWGVQQILNLRMLEEG